jgi:hypothetical protein
MLKTMRKYLIGVIALLNSAILTAGSFYVRPRPAVATQFLFIGTTVADYYVASGWKIASPNDPECTGEGWPSLVSHPTITTPAAVASTLSTAAQGSIKGDLAFRNFTIITECDHF